VRFFWVSDGVIVHDDRCARRNEGAGNFHELLFRHRKVSGFSRRENFGADAFQ